MLLAMSNTTPVDYSILAARRISPLRQRMIDDMTVRNFAPNTVAYQKQVSYFAQHFGRSPERLGAEEIRSYQIYLAKERRVSISSRTVAANALRFLYCGSPIVHLSPTSECSLRWRFEIPTVLRARNGMLRTSSAMSQQLKFQ